MRFKPSFFLAATWVAGLLGISASVQAQAASAVAIAAPAQETIAIDKIDPPDWWVNFPSPMLLVHGSGLASAHFSISGQGVTLARTQSSANGHWAFLWLRTEHAPAQTLTILATNGKAEIRASYTLAARNQSTASHAGFSAADAMYLIMPDRFADAEPNPPGDTRAAARGWHGGDLAGVTAHLDYLQSLGVTTVWTTPVLSNGTMPESYHGYAATDLYAVDAHFGSLADYRNLSSALHARGMKLVVDLVPNHVGVQHPWMADPPAPDWFHDTRANHLAVDHDFHQLVDPHAAPAASLRITRGWFSDDMPDLNQSNPLVAQYFIQNALWWVETANLDGIRLDTFPYVDRSYWQDFHRTLHQVYPHLTTVGEVYNRDAEVVSFFAGGRTHAGIDTGLDTPFDFPLQFALRDVLAAGKPMTELTDVLRQDALYPHPERLVTFIGNHDTTRFLTEAGGSVPRLKLAIGLIATLRGMPQLYSGDEIAMTGGADPDNRHDFPGGFPGDARSAFTAAGRTATEQDVYQWTAGLLALRKAHAEFATGMEQNLFTDADAFVFVRTPRTSGCPADHAEERMLIVVNKAHARKSIDLPLQATALAGCEQYAATAPGSLPIRSADTLHLEIPAETLSVYTVR
jgi:glycosidase